jgi:hypothetical protein
MAGDDVGRTMRAQITLTTQEVKWLIALAIGRLPEVQRALGDGRILLKGGTTVSAVAEELAGIPLRISGRVTPLGAKAAHSKPDAPHTLLLAQGRPFNADGRSAEVAEEMDRNDVAIIGANALDIHGNAALMAGAPLGGGTERLLEVLSRRKVKIIIPAGLEKLIPNSIQEAVQASGQECIDLSMGMGVGLMTMTGRVITEVESIEILAQVTATVIGAGGIMGAEGATTLVIKGEDEEVRRFFGWVQGVKGAPLSGEAASMAECEPGDPACSRHRVCVYRMPHLLSG